MKLIREADQSCRWEMEAAKFHHIQILLQSYPMLQSSVKPLSEDEALQGDQHLLEEALAEQRKIVKERAAEILSKARPIQEPPDSVALPLNEDELETLLQIFGDLRVGAWTRLGCPDSDEQDALLSGADPMSAGMHLLWTMHKCGFFQALIIAYLEGEEG